MGPDDFFMALDADRMAQEAGMDIRGLGDTFLVVRIGSHINLELSSLQEVHAFLTGFKQGQREEATKND